MKRIILLTIFLLLTAIGVTAQPTSNTARHITYGSSLPATCNPATGDVFWKTSATIGIYMCLTTNTWTAVPTSAGAGTVTTVSVVTANGFSGSVANATTTPAITINNPTALVASTSVAIGGGSAITSSGAGGSMGTAAFQNTGTSGANIPFLNGVNTWSAANGFGAITATSLTALTGATTPNAAGGTTIGSNALPFSSVYIGGAATNNFQLTGTATAARVVTFPDVASYTLAQITNGQTFTGVNTFTSPNIITGINDTNSNQMFKFTATASAVDGWTWINSAAANPGVIETQATGTDTNIGFKFTPKGTGGVLIPSNGTNTVSLLGLNLNTAVNPLGFYAAASTMLNIGVNGTDEVSFNPGKVNLKVTSVFGWINVSNLAGSCEACLNRVAAKVIAAGSAAGTADHWLIDQGAKRASADLAKTTNTTLADVTGTPTALVSGRTYTFIYDADFTADATGGHKWAAAYSSTTSAIAFHITATCDTAATLIISSRQTTSGGSAGQAACVAGHVQIVGSLTTTGAGNLSIQFAQNATTGTSTALASGSRLWIRDTP